ncbi:MAG: helix-turn-helix transcriptional regulator [Clostridia bacterium]|nr:helix-turn-helix transcriptional regulator [Clostridia bacterium]
MQKDIDYKAMGSRIRAARKKKGITQDKLGELCAISTAHIGHIERGTRIPSADTLFRLSGALDISLDYLFFDSQTETDNILKSISAQLAGKDGEKVKIFISTVKALADKIDEL